MKAKWMNGFRLRSVAVCIACLAVLAGCVQPSGDPDTRAFFQVEGTRYEGICKSWVKIDIYGSDRGKFVVCKVVVDGFEIRCRADQCEEAIRITLANPPNDQNEDVSSEDTYSPPG